MPAWIFGGTGLAPNETEYRSREGRFVRGGITMSIIRGILLHMCVICSLVCMTAKILDWYNPYMNFTGHIWGIQMVLYMSAIILGITRKYAHPNMRMGKK